MSAIGVNRFTIQGKLNLDAIVYGVVVEKDEEVPSPEQVIQGLNSSGKHAVGAGSVSSTANTTFTLHISAPSDDPIYDVYVAVQNITDAQAFLDQMLPPPSGKEYVLVDNIPWPVGSVSVLENVTPPAINGDVIKTDLTTTPSGDIINITPNGTFEIN